MRLSRAIDLGRSLRLLFGADAASERQVRADQDRQTRTAEAILTRFIEGSEDRRRELVLLADEVGLGKTYVALAVAATILDLIRGVEAPEGFPANRPVVLVLTPNNDPLYDKWFREAEAFQHDCEREGESLSWLRIERPLAGAAKGNLIRMTESVRKATRKQPVLLIAKLGVLGAALHDRDVWRRRALACAFDARGVRTEDRQWCCRQVLGSGSRVSVPELLDLRKSNSLWADTDNYSPDLRGAYQRALRDPTLLGQLTNAISDRNGSKLADLVDDLTRAALVGDWPLLPLVIIDEVHGLKNQTTQARRHVERHLGGRACRVLGLSATPFQLRHDELISVLGLRSLASMSWERSARLGAAVTRLADAMREARDAGDQFRRRWRALRLRDRDGVHAAWEALAGASEQDRAEQLGRLRPPRVAHALETAFGLEACNRRLKVELHPFVIRHRHRGGYREHFVGKSAVPGTGPGRPHFVWAPGMDVGGDAELTHYLMMRAVALAKEEKGLPGLGAELTGSYRHLIQTSAVWRRLAQADNPLLPKYRELLEVMLPVPQADGEHCKVKATVARALDFFRHGQKTLIFCVYTKTAEAIRDELTKVIDRHLGEVRDQVFGGGTAFENFRKRFFNRREPLFSLIQDHPLLCELPGGRVGVLAHLRLGAKQLRDVARTLVERGEAPETDKPDRRLILAAVEQIAVRTWCERPDGRDWLDGALAKCPELKGRMADDEWLNGREPLSRRPRGGRTTADADPEANDAAAVVAPDEEEEERAVGRIEAGREEASVDAWVERLCGDALGDAIAPYFQDEVTKRARGQLPLLAAHHGALMAQLDLTTRAVAGGVFRRVLMAEEFMLRYLVENRPDQAEEWADYLASRYTRPLGGHLESLRARVAAYLETLARARKNTSLLAGYHAAAENRNKVQLVHGGTSNRGRYFLGFNTPYRPEILISTSVGQEGIDLHRECRHVIHHDLCWNPATIEQRTGRVDRIGSKVERERAGAESGGPTLEIAVPYLAATYDERMFEELYRRAQLFEVTLGGDVRVEGRVEGRIEVDDGAEERERRRLEGVGTDDEDLGQEAETGMVDLPEGMVERLRVDLSVWREQP